MPTRGRPADEQQRELVLSFHRRGLSVREIAAHPDVSLKHSRISDIVRSAGPSTEVEIRMTSRGVTLSARGLSTDELAEVVQRALERAGRPARIAEAE